MSDLQVSGIRRSMCVVVLGVEVQGPNPCIA